MAQPRLQSEYDVAPGVRQFIGGRTRKMLIDGKWVEAASGKTFTTYDPATEEPLAEVAAGEKEDVDRAVRAARAAFETGPWLRGGSSTLRGLDPAIEPYIGPARPFGGCHPGGCYASMVDGSVRFIKDSIDPPVFRALLTRAGGPAEVSSEVP